MDTSALVLLARSEPERSAFNTIIASGRVLVGAPTLLKASMVLPAMVTQERAEAFLARFLADPWVEALPFSVEMFRAAFDSFGKGRHPAKLNYGDCMAYAVAKVRDVPLLYKGRDFSLTNMRSAWSL